MEGQPPCSSPEARQFDFWLGEWEVTWGEGQRGSNHIQAVLDGCVILENFDGGDSMTLRGMSVSAFDPQSAHWRQTWVDNDGTYLDFTGAVQGENMILARTFTRAGKVLMQRMVFRDIKPDSLIWDWQRSTDQGKTWENLWTIFYRRAK